MSDRSLGFAIVTPSLNQGHFLADAIRSVLDQQYANVTYLVIDGGSTDQTHHVLDGFRGSVRCIVQRDHGQADALARGFGHVGGDILGWLNADDRYAPGALAAVAEFFARHPEVALLYGDAVFIDRAGRRIARCAQVEAFNFERLLNVGDYIVQPAAFFRRSVYEAVGGIDPTLRWAMDYDLWLNIARRFKVAYLPRVLAEYRWHGANKTATAGAARLDEVRRVARRHGAPNLPVFFALESAAAHLADALRDLSQGRFAPAARSLDRAGHDLLQRRVPAELLAPRTWRMLATRGRLRRAAIGDDRTNVADARCRGRAGF